METEPKPSPGRAPLCGDEAGAEPPRCDRGGHPLAGAAYLVGTERLCLRHATTSRRTIGRSLGIAGVVGTALVAVNQLDVLVADGLDAVVVAKIGMTYTVPFVVATFSALAAVRVP